MARSNPMTASSKLKRVDVPGTVVLGHDAVDRIGDLVAESDRSEGATVVCDPITRSIAGERVADLVGKADVETGIVEVDEATEASVAAVEEAPGDLLIGVGGGTVIDVTKLASHRTDRPFVSVPTSAAHDGICSPRASIKSDRGSSSEPAHPPTAVVADTAIVVEAPYRMVAAGCADAVSNLTAILDWELAHRVKEEPISTTATTLCRLAAESIVDGREEIGPDSEEGVRTVLKALIASGVGMAVAGSSRPASGAEHLWSHVLDRMLDEPAMHGEQVGVGSIVAMHLHGGDHGEIRDVLADVGAPTTLAELGIDRETAVEAWTSAHTLRDRYTILGDDGIDAETAEAALEATGVV